MIVVTAASFSKDSLLCQKLASSFPHIPIVHVKPEKIRQFDQLALVLAQAEAWLVGREEVSEALLSALPRLRVIAKYGVGLDNVDLEACARRGIKVAWEAGVNRDAVAEHTIGLMLATCRRIGFNARQLAQGIWIKDGGINLSGRRVGLVGLGHVGSRVAMLLKAFGCEIRFCDLLRKDELAQKLDILQFSYIELLDWAEIISFHVPLTPLTIGMCNRQALQKMRRGVYIINTSRGSIIDEDDLKQCLKSGQVAGAGLDVFDSEPLQDKDLYSLDNLVCTPHTAGNSREAVQAMGEAAIRGLQKELG